MGKTSIKLGDTLDNDTDIKTELLSIDANFEKLMQEVPQQMKVIRDPTTNHVIDFIPPSAPSLPKLDPRDNHLPQFQTSEMDKWKSFLVKTLKDLRSNRNVWINGNEMSSILKNLFGATEEDLVALENSCDNMNHDPALKFRKMANCRLGLDLVDGTARRLERSPHILTANEGFKRHDSGKYRFFGEVQDWVVQNTAFQAIIKFKSFMMYNVKTRPRKGCDPNAMFSQTIFFARTISTPNIMGEPAAEGVHQDGVEFTMTTLLKSKNVDYENQKAAISHLFNLNQTIGVSINEANSDNVISEAQHRHFLDTLLFIDNEMSHAVSTCKMIDPTDVAFRDMLLLFSRRMAPRDSSFISAGFDSVKSHPLLPSAFALKSKVLMELYPTMEKVLI